MKSCCGLWVAILLVFSTFETSAAVLYVSLNSANPVSPYADWSTAATNIQDAISASTNGDLVLVTNGIYATGGKSMDGVITNRITLDKAITVQSVNGPFVTVLQGAGVTNGPSAVRGAWLTNNAALVGFTVQNGATQNSNSVVTGGGGGVWCASSSARVVNCVINYNTAYYYGGGVYQGSLQDCFLAANSNNFSTAGATYNSRLSSCTVVSNKSGVYFSNSSGGATNCILYFNSVIGNYAGVLTFSYCCTTPLPPGAGNFTNGPGLFADGIHLANGSPCIGAGTNVVNGTDIFGQTWTNPPSIGCAEWQPTPTLTSPQIQLTGSPVGFIVGPVFTDGQPPFAFQWLKDGTPLQDDGHFSGSQTTNLIATGIKSSDAGAYQLVASNAIDTVTSTVAQLVIHYVNSAGVNPQSPYTNWITAATNIQDAIDAAAAEEIVFVTNGVYATGGRTNLYSSTNRVVLDKALTVISVNGYTSTTIQGAWDPVSTNGPLAVRCAWLASNAILCGFTLENGATGAGSLVGGSVDSGGGIFCASTNSIVSNCVLTNNSAVYGAGACSGNLYNCLLIGNTVFQKGGGAILATLNNCTVVSNYCNTYYFSGTGNGNGAGALDCIARNCILLNNFDIVVGSILPYYRDNYGYLYSQLNPQLVFTFCDTDPAVSNTGNIDAFPEFLDSFHITSTSPCRGAGSALYSSGTDLDGEAWANPPSMGCDEVVLSNRVGPLSVNMISFQTNVLVSAPAYPPPAHYGYFQGNINGLATYFTWSFGDGPTFTNLGLASSYQWTNTGDYTVTFTAYNTDNPAGVSTNTLVHVLLPNVPQLQSPLLVTNGFQFQFAGQWNANYTIQYATNLAAPVTWQTLQTIVWNFNTVVQINDNSPTNAARFYRVLAQ